MAKQNFWKTKINFAGLSIPRFMAAPIDGITDSPFRQLFRQFSKEELLHTEMRHVASVMKSKKNKSLNFNKLEKPLAFQISANSTDFIHNAVEKIIENGFDQINLNVGCPAKNVVKSGSGSALMSNIPMLKNIIKLLKKLTENKIPITIKIRAGFREKNALQIAQISQDLGMQGLIIHPRTQAQGFASIIDFDLVKQIKEKIKIPVIFSGNINSLKKAKEAYEKTGADGFMIGRALYGSPWKIKEITENAADNNFHLTNKEKLKLALKHLNLNQKFYDNQGFHPFKKHLPGYIKNLKNAGQIRQDLIRSKTFESMEKKFKELLNSFD